MIRCKKCGTANAADAVFCSQCDAFLEWSGEKVEDEGAPGTGPTAPPGEPGAPPGAQPAAARPTASPHQPSARGEPAVQPQSRRPEKGATTPVRKAKPQQPTKPEKPKPGQRVCPRCGTGNDPDRKFCRRCGTGLGIAPVAPPEASKASKAPKHRSSWLSGLLRRGKQEAYMAGQRPQSMLSSRSRWRPGSSAMVFGLLALFGLGSIASYLYVPGVGSAVDDVIHTIQSRVGDRAEVNITKATGPSEPGFPATNMIDGGSNTYWVGTRTINRRWLVDFELQRQSDLLQINIRSGADGEEYEKLGRPFRFQLRANGELSPEYRLDDSKDEQVIEIDIQDVKELRLIVLSQHQGLAGGEDIAIREIALLGPKG